ncbi:MAG: hypothetical protein ACOCQG_05110 [Candidatus Nanoarchaeia archaeon]
MAIKTFNVDEETYKKFSEYCKDLGLSMSRQIDMFMRSQVEEEAREEYLQKLDKIRKGKFVKVNSTLSDRYNV